MDKLDALVAFRTVAEEGSFTRAAARLGLTSSAVTKGIAQLERRLLVQLLVRSTRQLSLTSDGKQFYERCVRALAELDSAQEEMNNASQSPVGHVHIALPVVIARMHVIPRLAELLDAHPGLNVEIKQTDSRSDLIAEGIDIALWTGELPDSRLIGTLVAKQKRVTCATPAYLERFGTPSLPSDLHLHNCLRSRYTGSNWLFRMPDGEQTIAVRGSLLLDNSDGYRQAALSGLGIAQATWLLFAQDLKSGALKEILSEFRGEGRKFWLVFPRGQNKSPKVKVAADFLRRVLAG